MKNLFYLFNKIDSFCEENDIEKWNVDIIWDNNQFSSKSPADGNITFIFQFITDRKIESFFTVVQHVTNEYEVTYSRAESRHYFNKIYDKIVKKLSCPK